MKSMLWLGPLLWAPLGATAQSAAFVNVNVVDVAAGSVRPQVTVVVSGGRIVRIGPKDSVAVPAEAERIDGQGGFLIPGLADMHAHFARPEDLTVLLAHGVTRVQFLNATTELLDWRDSVARGRVLGPEIDPCMGPITGLESVAQALRVVARARAAGFDCLKPYDAIQEPALRSLTAEARAQHLRTVGHIPRNLTWEQDLEARPDAVAHAEEFLYSPVTSAAAVDSIVREMAERHIALIPTLIDYDLITRQIVGLGDLLRDPALAYVSPVHRRLWDAAHNRYARTFKPAQVPDLRRRLIFQRILVRRADSGGVRILAGTDAGNILVLPGVSLHQELEQMVLSGMSPAAVLRSATLAPAEFLGVSGRSGTVSEGKDADLVLLYGNPLSDITCTTLIAGVMRGGRWLPRERLQQLLDTVKSGYRREQHFLDDVDHRGATSALRAAAVQRYRPDSHLLNELAYQMWRVARDTLQARVLFSANVRLHPGDWIAESSLADWLESAGDLKGAARAIDIAMRSHPHDPDLRDQRDEIQRKTAAPL